MKKVANGRQRGFTLIEILIAMTLLGLLMAMLFGGLRLGTRAWEASDARSAELARLEAVHGFIRRALTGAYPLLRTETGGAKRRIAFTGGAEAGVSRMGLASFHASRALSTGFNDDPDRATRPFDVDRDGFVLAEGAATLIIEDLEYAQERGAEVIAELISYGQSADAFHVTQPSENGEGAARAMQIALGHAEIAASDIDYVNAHGTSTQLNDKFETMSMKTVFGESVLSMPISATKSMVGHTLGACGAIEGAVTALSLRDQRIHMTRNLDNPDPDCDLDYVPEGARDLDLTYAMSNSLGFGGHNTSLIFRRFDG
ncbi:MAG: prepilin-type N-terminal cleavage/methylation domain-containing protein [Proteobacteria bacterium]|nr:prepilin-type N-terminal cleavage/methylation domain-containing protein [Pseudomonadota bacterium]